MNKLYLNAYAVYLMYNIACYYQLDTKKVISQLDVW